MRMRWILSVLLLSTVAAMGQEVVDLKDVGAAPDAWTPRDPAQVTTAAELGKDSSGKVAVRFEVKPGVKEWVVIDGPVIPIGKRTKFHKDRIFSISVDIKNNGLTGYATQFRLRQGKTGSNYTRNLAPHSLWETAAEMSPAEKFQEWTTLKGASSASSDCDTLVLELWIAPPKSGQPAALCIRDIAIKESFTIAHIIRPEPAAQGSIFFDDKGSVVAEFVNPDSLKSCKVVLTDEEGRQVGIVEGGAKTPSLNVPLAAKGFYAITASAEYEAGPAVTTNTTAAVVGAPLPDDVRRASRLGSMSVWAGGGIYKNSGANWDWGIGGLSVGDFVLAADGSITPPPTHKPQKYPADKNSVYTFSRLPKWLYAPGQSGDGLFPPKDWKQLEDLFAAVAKANPELPYFCPYNEPDAHWRGSAEEFVKFHKTIRDGVKRGNPAMKVYGPCMYSIRMNDVKKYADLGLLNALDGIVMHAYVNATAPEGEFMDNVTSFVAYLREKGKADWPVYITEYGWCTGTGDWQKTIPELTRSRYAARSITLMATQPLDAIEYFCFKYTDNTVNPGYSLLFKDDTPTATFVAFVNTLKWLSWTRRGDGRWLKFSPSLHLALFDNGSKAVGAAWCAEEAGSSTIKLPSVPGRAADAMGREVKLTGEASVAVSPTPVFFELTPGSGFKDMEFLPIIKSAPAGVISLPWQPFFSPPELSVTGTTASIKPDALPGDYLLVGQSGGKWQGQPVRVAQPLTLQSLDFALSADGKSFSIVGTLLSALDGETETLMRVKLEDGKTLESKAALRAAAPAAVSTAIPNFVLGRRYKGTVEFTLTGKVPWKIEKPFDQTYVGCPILKEDARDGVNWNHVTAVDFSNWGPFPPQAAAASDCAAEIKTAIGEKGFHLLVNVTDNCHKQTQSPSGMWQEDSIQVAFDVDADKEWQPNNVGNGFNGHRILEYGIALHSKDKAPMVWRWRADAPNIKAACAEPKVAADVTREGAITCYKVFFPWSTLALTEPPRAGSNLGFAIAVNDSDESGGRHGLRMFGGIIDGKNPENFGKLRIVELETGK